MKRPQLNFVALFITVSASILWGQAPGGTGPVSVVLAQGSDNPIPQFTLTISELHRKDSSPGSQWVRVTVTNTSNKEIHVDGCAAARGFYKASVVYGGVPLIEQEAVARRLHEERMRRTNCKLLKDVFLRPGESYDDGLLISGIAVTGQVGYDMSKPGNYEVTVETVASPESSEGGNTARSNTIIITVPPISAQRPGRWPTH